MGKHTAKYQGCIKRKEEKAALAKEASERGRNSGAKGYPDALKAQTDWPFAEQMDVGERVESSSEEGVVRQPPMHPQTKSLPSAGHRVTRVA